MRLLYNNVPFFPYEETPASKWNDGTLYHYTTAKAAKSILRSMRLKLSAPDSFNDPCDCSLYDLPLRDFPEEDLESDWSKIRVLCFTRNYKVGSNIRYGYQHPRMWAQYADDNRGVCIAIDKKSFLQENATYLKNKWHKFSPVSYSFLPSRYLSEYALKHKNFGYKVEKFAADLFFSKSSDWRDEREYRFVGIDVPDYLSIKNSTSFIVLGSKINIEDYSDIVSIVNDVNNASYACLGSKSFVQAEYHEGNVNVCYLETSKLKQKFSQQINKLVQL